MKKIIRFMIVLAVITSPRIIWAAEPIDELKNSVEKIIQLLKNADSEPSKGQGSGRREMMNIVKDIFDFTELSKRTVASNWKKFTPNERKVFADIFAEFIGSSYYGKIKDSYSNESVVYDSQEKYSKEKALVKTRIPRAAGDIPVYYRMMKKDGNWKVYDVLIENVSLVKNYRTQFRSLLRSESPAQLIERLKQKTDEEPSEKKE